MKENPLVLKKRFSELPRLKARVESMRNSRLHNCETFVSGARPEIPITQTLKKIMQNTSVRKIKRNNSRSLHSYLSERTFKAPILDANDDKIIEKINRHKTRLRIDRELRALYSQKRELKTIESLPIYPKYIGHSFRQ